MMASFSVGKLTQYFKSALKHSCSRSSHHLASARYAQTLLNLPETKVSELKNGFRVATEQTDSPTSTVGVWIDSGSRYENDENNGVAHFFEHLAYKGTSKHSLSDMEKEIANLGAKFNSYTCREETAFYANCLSSDVPKVAEILADVFTNKNLDEMVIERERKVILQELDEIETDLKQVAFDYLHLTAYQGTPLSKSIYGSSANVKRISKDDIAYYVQNNFLAPRMVLVASGNVRHEDMVKLAEKCFSSVPDTYESEIPVLHPCRFTGSEIRARDDWLPFAHVAIAVDTCGANSPDIFPLMLAQKIVGKWNRTLPSSADTTNRLIQNIHKGAGCQSFESFYTVYRDTGLWGCYFVMDGMVLDDFMYNLQTEWLKLCVNVTETELEIAKNMLRTDILLDLGNQINSCRDIGYQVLHFGERTSVAEIEENIEAVSIKDLRDTCSKYIYDRCPAIAAVGPVEALPDYTRIRANMYWLRF